VRADESRLRQVVVNLLKNAVNHCHANGRIWIRSSNPDPHQVIFSIRDDGRGLDRELLPRLFEPFEQVLEPSRPVTGLGLGLSICKGIIEAHGGRISGSSEGPEKGAAFGFELATVQVEADLDRGMMRSAPDRHASTVKILLVEDNHDNAESMGHLLESLGYRVRIADSVESALRAATEPFDVLVCDIGLPDGDGRQLVRELSRERAVPAIALSGYGTREDVSRNLDAGFRRHLTKPIDAEELIAAIDSVLTGNADPQ
jgi:CheY-like chemotaxis protein